MKPIHDYATARAATGEAKRLSIGGHICQIRGARCDISRSGKEMLVLAFDIKEGSEFDGFYKRMFDRIKGFNQDAKWPGCYYAVTTNNEGNTNPMFKGLITCIEESNPGYKWDWNENTLNGKMIGFNFGEEEYLHQSTGEIRTNVKPVFPAPVARVREGLTPPEPKRLNNVPASFPAPSVSNPPRQMGFSQVEDDDLPF